MKKLHLLLLCFILAMISCKKETITSADKEYSTKISYLKNWYALHTSNEIKQFSKDEFTLYPQNILWETGIYLSESNRYVFSLNEFQDAELSIPKLIVFYLNEDGEVTNSEYVFIRVNENTTGMTLPEILAAYVDVFENENIPESLELSMLKFNMDGVRIFSKHIENGEFTDTDEQIKSVEKAPMEAGLEFCVDHWWVIYVNGQVYSIEYTGSDCYCYGCNQNGGGGGSGTTGTLTCDVQASQFVNAGHATNGYISRQLISQTSTTEAVSYHWKIYDAFTWFLSSIEDANIEKFYHIVPGGTDYITREFTSFSHRTIYQQGINFGGTRTFQDNGATINFNKDIVSERIDFTVTHTPVCNNPLTTIVLPPQTFAYYANGIFVANQSVTPY